MRLKAVVTDRRETSEAIIEALSRRYVSPEWAFFPQVRNSTGFPVQSRTADAVAINLWPSRGLELLGFEVKVSRGDWLRELREPEKAEELFAFCDRWWLVAADPDVVKREELPATWGLLILRGQTQLRCEVDAPKLSPALPDRPFLAALLRRAAEVVTPPARLRAEYVRGLKEGRKEERHLHEGVVGAAEADLMRLQRVMADFERASGVTIDSWNRERIGEAVRQVLGGPGYEKRITKIREMAEAIIRDLDGQALPRGPAE